MNKASRRLTVEWSEGQQGDRAKLAKVLLRLQVDLVKTLRSQGIHASVTLASSQGSTTIGMPMAEVNRP